MNESRIGDRLIVGEQTNSVDSLRLEKSHLVVYILWHNAKMSEEEKDP